MKVLLIVVQHILVVASLDFSVRLVHAAMASDPRKIGDWSTIITSAISNNLIFRLPQLIVEQLKKLVKAIAKLVIASFDMVMSIAWSVLPGLDNTPRPKFADLV